MGAVQNQLEIEYLGDNDPYEHSTNDLGIISIIFVSTVFVQVIVT